MQWIYWVLVIYVAGLVAWHLLRGRRFRDQLTAALVLLPLLLRAFWIR
ncbi:hypothetical protein [Limnochorda pilosa]|uniref:Uncharacterized protein n=1 Tax=Limnochorda pilosa TaxID=1555112 RepID=A0A0K2SGS9_LIMPI|nr:hypothetical protein [Limnochorda pilosa]BAS26295.1 hypothetical protein LIP_0438 [Limnochorda pilosa]